MVYIRTTQQATLIEELERKAVTIAKDVAISSTNLIETNNNSALSSLAQKILNNNDDISYIFFLDDLGNVLAHTFKEDFPTELLEINQVFNHEGFSLEKFQMEEVVLRDVAVPIFEDSEYVVRVGVHDSRLKYALNSATHQFLIVVAITFIISSIAVYMLTTSTVIKPLNTLQETVHAVSKGDLSQRVLITSQDELSQLGHSFNIMIQRLDKAQKSRNILMKKIVYTQEEERKRISRELHDETGQSLTTLLIALQLIEDSSNMGEIKEKIGDFRSLLLHTLENVRFLSWKLTPLPLVDLGLKAALESFVKKYAKNDNWHIDLKIIGLEDKRLSSEIETAIYRVVQEALTNAAKHAGATQVSVILEGSENYLYVTIKDNGKGFNLETAKETAIHNTSLGLASMEERIFLINGTFTIKSGPYQGTSIYIEVPLKESGGNDNFQENTGNVG